VQDREFRGERLGRFEEQARPSGEGLLEVPVGLVLVDRWSDAAVDIQHNRSVSLTASASQVRRPIYGSSSGRWRRYERHLGELIAALREQAVPSAD
jgi:hypothetical protein